MSEQRDVLEVDIVFVGAGIASLSCAYHLKKLISQYNLKAEQDQKIEDPTIAIIEKASGTGEHSLSGAILDPRALRNLVADFKDKGAPIDTPVTKEDFYFVTGKGSFRMPMSPPGMDSKGCYIISLSKFTRWMEELAAKEDIDIFNGFAANELLFDGDTVCGVRTADKGLDKEGNKKSNFTPGIDIKAKVTVLGEGNYGVLSQALIKKKGLDRGKKHQVYGTAVKEVWEIKPENHKLGRVVHTLGWPFGMDTFGGSFMYFGKDNMLYMGLIAGLDYKDPMLDPHKELQRFKEHPMVKKIIEGGKLLEYGAKTIPEGGFFTVPKPYCSGCLMIGDGAGLLDNQRLKGIHMAMESGMMAAETMLEALKKNDFSGSSLSGYMDLIESSQLWKDLKRARNFRQTFSKHLLFGMADMAVQTIAGGASINPFKETSEDRDCMKKLNDYYKDPEEAKKKSHVEFDEKYTFDKLTSVYLSGTQHEENQPAHVTITDTSKCEQCTKEFGNPCQYFCPGKVFSVETEEDGKVKVELTPSNCLHCKTCAIKDPYGVIEWTVPEDGGPKYKNM